VFFPGYFTTPAPPFLRGILYAIYRITHLNKMKIPIQLNYVKQDLMQNHKKPITVTYENEIVGEFIADIIVNDTIILELSCLSCRPVKS